MKLRDITSYLKKIGTSRNLNDIVYIVVIILILGYIGSNFVGRMSNVMAISITILFGLICGELVQKIKIPKVIGYVCAGMFLGPFMAGIISKQGISDLRIISDVTLGLIILDVLDDTGPPFYVAFFVISGAMLHIDSVQKLGFIGLGYVIARISGKIIGVYMGAVVQKAGEKIENYMGMGLIPQAGVAIGVSLAVEAKFPEFGAMLVTLILSSVIIFEIAGPIMTKFALSAAQEISEED